MEGQNHRLKQGHVNKVPLLIALVLCALSLILIFIFTNNHKVEKNLVPTVPYDLETQLKKAHKNSIDISSNYEQKYERLSKQEVIDSFLDNEEEIAKKEVLDYEKSISTYEDEYRRYQERLPKSRLRHGQTLEEYVENKQETNVNQSEISVSQNNAVQRHKVKTDDNYISEQNSSFKEALKARSKVKLQRDESFDKSLSDRKSTPSSKNTANFGNLSKYQELSSNQDESPYKVKAPKSKFMLMQGSIIQAVLLNGINSELPGQITAQVTDNILDTASGKYLLIPKGSKLVGQYGTNARFAQEKLFLGFNRIIFPDGSSMHLNAMPGQSTDGYAGLDAEVDNHFFKTLTSCFFLSTLTTANYMEDRPKYDDDGYMTMHDAFSQSLSDNVNRALSKIIERNLNIAPTLKVKPGFLLSIAVTEDLEFPHAYKLNNDNEFLIQD